MPKIKKVVATYDVKLTIRCDDDEYDSPPLIDAIEKTVADAVARMDARIGYDVQVHAEATRTDK